MQAANASQERPAEGKGAELGASFLKTFTAGRVVAARSSDPRREVLSQAVLLGVCRSASGTTWTNQGPETDRFVCEIFIGRECSSGSFYWAYLRAWTGIQTIGSFATVNHWWRSASAKQSSLERQLIEPIGSAHIGSLLEQRAERAAGPTPVQVARQLDSISAPASTNPPGKWRYEPRHKSTLYLRTLVSNISPHLYSDAISSLACGPFHPAGASTERCCQRESTLGDVMRMLQRFVRCDADFDTQDLRLKEALYRMEGAAGTIGRTSYQGFGKWHPLLRESFGNSQSWLELGRRGYPIILSGSKVSTRSCVMLRVLLLEPSIDVTRKRIANRNKFTTREFGGGAERSKSDRTCPVSRAWIENGNLSSRSVDSVRSVAFQYIVHRRAKLRRRCLVLLLAQELESDAPTPPLAGIFQPPAFAVNPRPKSIAARKRFRPASPLASATGVSYGTLHASSGK
eukprot:scaffold226_cov167-Pinguiococcus_pyrenoidosus.AAC.11